MQTGQLTITGNNHISIILSGRPREVFCKFKHEHNHVPCNPYHEDHLSYHVRTEDEDLREHYKINHHHHDRQFYLSIKWEVSSVREIEWIVIY